jgi:glutathione synthase/RimK-type ligase-like ATP-grasp enzyme
MTGWVILVDQPKDLPNAETPHKVITTSEYLARPRLFEMARPKIVNLSRSYAYQSNGYYASLLAEARGHRVVPTVETMLELREAKLYEHALPELEDELNRCARRTDFQPEGEFKLLVCFGIARDPRFEPFGRLLFDWFRCPALEVSVDTSAAWLSIDRIRPRNLTRLANGEATFFREALHLHTKREWRDPKARSVSKYDLAVLFDPNEKMAPTSPASIKYFARIAEKLSVDIEPITKRQLAELAEYDGLFIRETTSIDNHTYRFARRAWQEGMPVIDDPISMIRCTNKVFLMELLGQNQVPTPATVMLTEGADLPRAMDELGLPLVVKIPDGSFSRGVHKVATSEEFKRIADELFEETDLLLAQKFLPTEFDWRVGVLSGEPLFVCQYRMARGHWQIVKHRADGSSREGGFRTFGLDQAPQDIVDLAVRAAKPIGDGFYGVDLKQTESGIVVMEVNDNPNLEHGIEDAVGKDEIWVKILKWFIERFEQ